MGTVEKFGDFVEINGKHSDFVQYINNQSTSNNIVYPPKMCGITDEQYSSDERILKIVQRYNFEEHKDNEYVKNIDNELNEKFIIKNCAALMFNVSVTYIDDNNDEKDAEKSFLSKETILLKFLKDIYDEFDSDDIYEIGKSWLLFRSSSSATNCFQCALKLQNEFKNFTANNQNIKMSMSGIGCDYGDIFMIKNTDICFC